MTRTDAETRAFRRTIALGLAFYFACAVVGAFIGTRLSDRVPSIERNCARR